MLNFANRRFTNAVVYMSLFCGGTVARLAAFDDLTLDQIIAKNEAAVGGSEALTNVKCTRMTADMVLAAGAPAVQMTITVKRPNLMLTEANSQGRKTVSGYDGVTAWSVNSATGEAQVMTLDSGTSANLSLFGIDAIIGSLRGLLAGQKAELVGSETVDGASASHIRATRSEGVVTDYYINGTTFLLGKTATQLPQQAGGQLLESYPADYRSTSGVTLWYSLDIRAADRP